MDEIKNHNEHMNLEEQIQQSINDEEAYRLYDFKKMELETLRVTAKEISKRELRFLIGIFYQIQKQRIACGNQIYAIEHAKTDTGFSSKSVIEWHYQSLISKEKQLQGLFKYYCNSTASGVWMSSIKGIGPTFTAILISHLMIEGRKAAGQFHSICGLNDNNKPWYGRERAAKIVDDVMNGEKKITMDHLIALSEETGRSVSTLEKMSYDREKKTRDIKLDKNGNPVQSVESLKKGLAMIPYNAFLKKTCYLIADSFVKNRNRGSLYGEIYSNRKAVDTKRNEEREFAEQAKKALEERNFTDKEVLKCYKDGKLPPLHIENRARRYAVKLFISHLFEQMWIEYHGTQPPAPYIIEYSDEYDHNGYIQPEVPFIWPTT